MRTEREFDIIVYGATGYTGRLVAEYLASRGVSGWAMAGRDPAKLAEVRDAIGAPDDTPLVIANADDPASLTAMAERTRVVLTTVGPYQLYGSDLVAACVTAGTDYADLCGEPNWMAEMIAAHSEGAEATGARITFSCGFDSIPFDLGVFALQDACIAEHGTPAPRVKGRVRAMKGTFSGGTAASLKATMAAAKANPAIFKVLASPFGLTPGFEGPPQPPGMAPEYDAALDAWAAPFVMAAINTKNVHRTNALLDHRYGTDFVYDEMMLTGPGDAGEAAAKHIATTPMIGTPNDPKPGEGPTKEERETGFYDVLFVGTWPDGREVRLSVRGDRDPGYGSTSKMIAETARCLAHDLNDRPGGIWTPGALAGQRLIDRLTAHAGLTFTRE